MKTLTIVLLVGVLLSGCTTYRWVHPNFSEADFRRHLYGCERDMRQSMYFGTGIAAQINAQRFQERCMVAHGYAKIAVDDE